MTYWLSRVILLVEVIALTTQERITEIEKQLLLLPAGTLTYKTIKDNEQPYLQWSERGKTISRYIKVAEREHIFQQLELREKLLDELRHLKEQPQQQVLTQSVPVYRTNVITGYDLKELILPAQKLRKRDCFKRLNKYMTGDFAGKVCLLYGLRRTGKTTLLLQAINVLTDDQFAKAVYIKATTDNTMADLNQDLKLLRENGYRYIFIDEVTLIEDFIDSAALLSDIYAAMGMKVVLSGTDSLGFWFTLRGELYDRAVTIHTTFIPFREFSRLLHINDIDEYIRYGGMLKAGELAFDDDDANETDASFRDDESTRRYIDTAICQNIQHSLKCCRDGTYFRHLQSLYDKGELTGAINRIIESMNHQFLLRILTRPFKSHDLGSAAEVLRKQSDPDKQSTLLDTIDHKGITNSLMDILKIKNAENMQIGLTQTHADEIKQYLTALDLVVDCPRETIASGADELEYVLFTQPGMRYCQAQALLHVLMKNTTFKTASEREKKLVGDRILEEVRGRMMEDIVLLETFRSLPKGKRAFKLTMSASEFDMVIYDDEQDTCELYEVKHSAEIVEHQYHVLTDEDECALVEKKYGTIIKKCVLYRGKPTTLDNGIEYQNVDEYLKQL